MTWAGTNNLLKNNIKKTAIMIVSNNKDLKQVEREMLGIKLKHSENVKILGTWLSDDLKWNHHINHGKESLIAQLKARMSAVKLIKRKVSARFAKIAATAIFFSKLTYHIEAYGSTTLTNKRKIDNIIIRMAKFLNGPAGLGRSDKWHLDQLG